MSMNPARQKLLEQLSQYVDGELSPEERQQVEQHLAYNKESASLVAEYSRGDDTVADRPLNTIDPARATAGLQYAAPGGSWRLQGLLTVAAAQDRVDESAGALARAGGFATFDLIGGWKLAEGVHLRAAVFNVFDRRYVEWSDVRGRLASDTSLDLYTRPGRSVTLGVTLQLD